MHLATLVVDRTASMRPRTHDLVSPSNRSQNVARVPRLHTPIQTTAGSVGPVESQLHARNLPAPESSAHPRARASSEPSSRPHRRIIMLVDGTSARHPFLDESTRNQLRSSSTPLKRYDEVVVRRRVMTAEEWFERMRNAAPPTDDDVTILWDGRRLDSREKVLDWLAEVEAKRAENVASGADAEP